MIKRTQMRRRSFLRGTLGTGLGVSLGLPLLEAMLNGNGTALAQDGSALPKRFGVFFWGNGRGVDEDRWRPTGTGANWTPSIELAPLAPIKEYISVVSGMNARLANSPQGHHKGSAAILSGYDFIAQEANNAPYRSTFAKPSIDQLVAAEIGKTTRFKSLELGTSRRVINGEGTTIQYISHNGPDSTNPPELDPRKVFDRLFAMPAGPVAGGTPAVGEALRMLRASVLDLVVEDLSALGRRVGAADRVRLEQHTEAIRAIERRLQSDASLGGASCEQPAAPDAIEASNSKEPLAERLDAMGDLLALAMSCDLTRVFSLQWSGSAGGPVFWQVGATRAHHDLSHDGESTQDVMEKITIFTMEQFALFLGKFRDTPDGAGNLLDSMAILSTSDHSDGAAHVVNDYPVVVAGRAGGALVHPGVHQVASNEHTNKVLLTVLRAVGLNIAEIGDGNYRMTEGVSALET